jgi:hypothetical protein
MLIIDQLLLSPIYGTVWAARQVHKAIEQERAAEPARITAELSELYMMLETGRMTEAEFDAREKVLLDQLDRLQEPENNHPEEAKHKRKQGAGRVTRGKQAIRQVWKPALRDAPQLVPANREPARAPSSK